ncbi:integrin alpha-8 [Salmo salar]|uniref:Integrin alpha-8 n=1 Tax=Salmo salar TaxID=8030 RepID=A0ABM3DHN0_SALSA|nr:integrin alpha-8 [Salmo salar]|eukprot:XP_014016065.1 PREDICTED: integrin alpha-8-like isoform X1 [Salmo salar]
MCAHSMCAFGGMLCRVVSVLWLVLSVVSGFNLHAERPAVYGGPEGSYFGYSVDFYRPTPESSTLSVLVGAPKANTSQPGIIEGGAVYYCPYPPNPDPTKQRYSCTQIPFDNANNRMIKVNGTREPLEFKSHQWFGASVRTHKGKVVACAPLYHWRTVKVNGEKDPVGTCYVAVQNFSAYAEYSPCRTNDPDPEGQGFCQAGFSVDFTKEGTLVVGGPGSFYWQGQVMTAGVAEILNGYSLKAVLRRVPGEKHTHAAADTHDDSYLGYSVAVGEFTGDSEQELIAGVPRGAQNFGYVAVINSTNLTFIMNFTGEQMASYFGYSVAVTDLNGDGYDDVLVGAPLYMERERESKPKEVGRVYLYLQHSPLTFSEPLLLTGTHTFGRFGTAIAPLGDLNQDGYNDVAVGCPFGGEDRSGLVLIYNGQRDLTARGLTLSQELYGAWASSSGLSGYGFTLRGDRDLDNNHYPDLIVGAFGKGEVSVYRARPVVSVEAEMILTPRILNPDDRSCLLTESDTMVTCLRVDICAKVSGVGIPDSVVLNAELQLDYLKGVRGGVKRVHFLDSHQPQHTGVLTLGHSRPHSCLNYTVYLREEDEFRDKLTPISLALNYSLAPPPSNLDLPPVLNRYSSTFLQEQAYILLDCGEDNECIPDLQLSASMDRTELVVGDDNLVLLTINAVNKGEGAYETELHTLLPPEADYIGVERRIESLSRLNCEYRMVNDSRLVVCDLGNPMVAGTEVSVGLRFAVQRLDDAGPHIDFDLQIHSSNKDNSKSNPVSLSLSISARAQLDLRGVCHPSQVVLPFPHWEPKEKPVKEDDVGPQVTHIYELHNSGPSSIREAELQVGWPSRFRDEHLLYALEVLTEGPISCRSNTSLNLLGLQTSSVQDTPELLGFLRNRSSPHRYRRATSAAQPYSSKTLNCSNIICLRVLCVVGRLDRGQSAVVKIRSRLWAHTFLQRRNDPYLLNSTVSFRVTALPYRLQPSSLPQHTTSMGTLVLWGTPDVAFAVPLWVIILAILLGLLVLAMLTLAMWKCGFFDRARLPAEDVSDREQLTSDQLADA